MEVAGVGDRRRRMGGEGGDRGRGPIATWGGGDARGEGRESALAHIGEGGDRRRRWVREMASACSGGQEPIAARGGWREVREAATRVGERCSGACGVLSI
jgi:hypothetical protein